jgi:hypothetical protein
MQAHKQYALKLRYQIPFRGMVPLDFDFFPRLRRRGPQPHLFENGYPARRPDSQTVALAAPNNSMLLFQHNFRSNVLWRTACISRTAIRSFPRELEQGG